MLDFLKNIFKGPEPVDYAALKNAGAQLIDVRTPGEFQSGHIQGAKNIPLNTISSKLSSIKKDKPVVLCCASGMRSGSATNTLKSKGYEAYNAGSWKSLEGRW